MTRTSWKDLRENRLQAMDDDHRAEYERAYAESRLAAEVGERIREARDAAGLSQRDLAARMGTSQAAVSRLEAGAIAPTLTTLQRAALALGLALSVDLRPTA